MQLRFMGKSYSRCEQARAATPVKFSGHFLGTTYSGPYTDSSQLPQENIELKFRGKSYKTHH